MTPVKLDKFLQDTSARLPEALNIDLAQLGLFHAAPKEDGRPILALRFDATSGTLVPAGRTA